MPLRGRRLRTCYRSALPPYPRAQEYTYIKRASDGAFPDPGEVFAPLCIDGVSSVGLLADRACTKFGWGVSTQTRLYLVVHPSGGDEPSAEAEAAALRGARLQSGWTLERAGVASGSWLLARALGPGGAWSGGRE